MKKECARKLMALLQKQQGKSMLLGQQESPRTQLADREFEWIQALTGELPAIRGLDFIHDDFAGVVRRARDWHQRGGIVTICWHTGLTGNDYPSSKEDTPDWEALLSEGSPENRQMIRHWEQAAEALKTLRDEDIPVLWRPFHEFDGQWFWWGKGGGEPFIRLWRMMHRFFSEDRGLDNLIWVLGYADDVRDGWNPGAACYDIVGSDTYRGETTHAAAFRRLADLYPGVPAAFHECGLIPSPDAFFMEKCCWSWLMTWHGRWLMDNHPDRIREVYQDARMITLRRLAALRNE